MNILSSLPVKVWIWLAAAVVLLIIEGLTAGLTCIWIAGGGFAAAVTALVTDNLIVQLLVFAVVSLILLAVTRPVAKKVTRRKAEPTNADALIGQNAVAITDVTELSYGEAKINGQTWTASLLEGSPAIKSGDVVKIIKIEGVKLVVEKENN